jgi:RND superfamily putative drug exporter
MNRFFEWHGRTVVRFRWVIVAVWLVGTIVAVKALPSINSQVNNNSSAFLPTSAPSNQAANLAKPLVGSTSRASVTVVAATTGGALTQADQSYLSSLTTELQHVPSVKRVQFVGVSPDRQAVQLLVVSSRSNFSQSPAKTLVNDLQGTLAASHPPQNLNVHVTGQLAVDVANNKQSAKAQRSTQFLTFLFILVLLFLIFRSLLAPFLTLLPAFLVLVLSNSLIGGLGSAGLKISSVTPLLLIVLVLGAGTDYGLFLVFRVREELGNGRDAHEAVVRALARVGESITASAATVIVALLSLLLASFGIYRDLGPPLAVGIAVMLLAGLTLVPALLALTGRAAFWPTRRAITAGEHREGWWGRVAARLVQRPGWTLGLGLVVFGALAAAVFGYKPAGFGQGLTAPAGSDAAQGTAALAAHFPKAAENPTNLVFRYPTSVWDEPSVLVTAGHSLEHSGVFSTLTGPLDPTGAPLSPAELTSLHATLGPAALLPVTPPPGSSVPVGTYDSYRATARYVSADGHTVQFEAGLRAGAPGTTPALNAVPAVRRAVASAAAASGATESGAAGEAPALYDVSTTSNGDLIHIVPLAALAIGLVLALVLRSLVAPLYLILSVVLSYLASLGLAVVFFIDLGGQGGLTFLLPFLMFIFLLALGEDYNILVMTRIREEAHRLPLRQAVIRAVGATGPTVTSAGLVLAGSFVVFAVSGGRQSGGSEITAIGIGLAVGILLDTFVVRTVLVPATVELLGRFNWWPGRMGRRDEAVAEGLPAPSEASPPTPVGRG